MGRFMGCRGVERSGGHSRFKALVRDDVHVPTNQNQDQITAICANLIGQRITLLQVLGDQCAQVAATEPGRLGW